MDQAKSLESELNELVKQERRRLIEASKKNQEELEITETKEEN